MLTIIKVVETMEQMKLIVYVKRDEHKSIVQINSNIFIENLADWEQVDEWQEGQDRYLYSHAGNGEYIQEKHGKPLYDEQGRPNFHDDFIEWRAEEKQAKYPIQNNSEKNEQEATLQTMMFMSAKTSFLVELPDNEAVKIPLCYEPWESFVGKSLNKDTRIEYQGYLWKVRQDVNVVLENQPPSIETASLYERIDVDHSGTLEDPIPYVQTMTVYKDKYYLENGKIYKCIRDSGQPLYASCESLLGNYFELAA